MAGTPRVFALALLATICMAFIQVEAVSHRRILADHAGTPVTVGTTLHGLSLLNISGVWQGFGDQFSAKVWDAYYAENTLPKCSASNTSSTYKHWREPFPDMLAFAYSTESKKGFGINGHDDGTYALKDVTFDGEYIKFTYEGEKEASCGRFSMYVDQRNGLVYSTIKYKSEWKLVKGKLVQKDLSCTLKAEEMAGCFPKGNDTVHSVSAATYACKAGACLGFSPAFKEHK